MSHAALDSYRGGAVTNFCAPPFALMTGPLSDSRSAVIDARSSQLNCGAWRSKTSSMVFALPSRIYGAVETMLRKVGTSSRREKFVPAWHDAQPRAEKSCNPRHALAGIAS